MGRKVEPICGGRALLAMTGDLIDSIVRTRKDKVLPLPAAAVPALQKLSQLISAFGNQYIILVYFDQGQSLICSHRQ